MSMTSYALGFRPKNDKWKKMKAVWDACKKADIDPPEEVVDFFDGGEPDDSGVVVDIGPACTEYQGDMAEGIEVDLDMLPEDVRIIRLVNSY